MTLTALPPIATSIFGLLAIAALLLTFVMLGSRWLDHYLYAFAAESWMIAGLSATVGIYAGYPELILIALLTIVFRGVLLPYLIWRIIQRQAADHEVEAILRPSSSLLVGAAAVIFALVVAYHIGDDLGLVGTVAVLALTVMLAMKLIGFLMLVFRHEAISQVLGLLVLENGIFLGAQILVPGMPMLFEIVILFDLLVAVACFGILVRYLRSAIGSTSSLGLRKLRG
ncbi:hydrogenase-4 component E [Hephaestia caeni]|uniref:Hydrogenase-4 component E n=1 Tax=Hephaestia caeni TaxID=645617 RepID=A0A397PLY0_9SPHN|nr:hydrogenase [Hephaestia caeni]RIA46701.1 hydrogenase-4 component E [Hephaestia caeni]